MLCQQCGFSHKTQFLICPECSTYQFRENSPLSSLVISFVLASFFFALTLFAIKVGAADKGNHGFAYIVTSHWINSSILLVSYWALFMIIGKTLDYLKQKKAMSVFLDAKVMSLLTRKSALTPDHFHQTIHEIRDELIHKGCRDITDYVIFDLIRKTLYHLETIQQKEEINNILSHHVQISQAKMEESFVMLKVFYWAIPILGFIGTVLGIGVAIGAFSDFISSGADASGMKSALIEVTKGLAVAFDSTLIALAFVVVILPIGTFIENLFDNLITQSEEYSLSFITPNMDFPFDEKSPTGILKKNIESLSIQSRYLQDFIVEFTSLCSRLGSSTSVENKTDSEVLQSDGEITEEVVENSTGVLPEGVVNTDSYPTEVIKAVSDSEIIQFNTKELEKKELEEEKIKIETKPIEASSQKQVATPPMIDDASESEVNLLETLLFEKENKENKDETK